MNRIGNSIPGQVRLRIVINSVVLFSQIFFYNIDYSFSVSDLAYIPSHLPLSHSLVVLNEKDGMSLVNNTTGTLVVIGKPAINLQVFTFQNPGDYLLQVYNRNQQKQLEKLICIVSVSI